MDKCVYIKSIMKKETHTFPNQRSAMLARRRFIKAGYNCSGFWGSPQSGWSFSVEADKYKNNFNGGHKF